jgi:hypothetical protein
VEGALSGDDRSSRIAITRDVDVERAAGDAPHMHHGRQEYGGQSDPHRANTGCRSSLGPGPALSSRGTQSGAIAALPRTCS